MIFWMLACQFTEQWGETSASVLTMLLKWVHIRHTMSCVLVLLCFCYICVLPPPVAAASGGTAYVGQLAMAVLRHPTGQVLFATWFAALAGLAAWYLM